MTPIYNLRLFIARPADGGDDEYIMAKSLEEARAALSKNIELMPEPGEPTTWEFEEVEFIYDEAK